MGKITKYILLSTVLASGLIAVLRYGYMCSVNPGLWYLDDNGYQSIMQSINEAISNPAFFFHLKEL